MCGQNGEEFGCQKCAQSVLGRKHGWVECESTSFPGKVYYFHTASRCSTWQRPVPRSIQLPRYKKWRDSRSSESQTEDKALSSELGVSGTECSVFSSAPLTEFELRARRMEIYLQKSTDFCLVMKTISGYDVRDKLMECYKSAKAELARDLKLKKPAREKLVKVETVKPANNKPQKITKPVKTIRECNGVKTISYDHVPRELPIGVKMPDLSETSIDSSNAIPMGFEQNQNCKIEVFGVKDVDLSESSETTASGLESLQS